MEASEIFQTFPSLSPAELRIVCVPSSAASGPVTTSVVLDNVSKRLDENHGSLPLDSVEKVDVTSWVGMKDATAKLKTQIIAPFQAIQRPTKSSRYIRIKRIQSFRFSM